MANGLKQALVLGALVAGAFGVATLLNGRRRKRTKRSPAEADADRELDSLQTVAEAEP